MRGMKETPLQQKIKAHLEKEYGCAVFKHHGSSYSELGVADLIGVMPIELTEGEMIGRAIAIEVKVPGAKTSKQRQITQARFLAKWKKAGAITGICTSIEDVDALLENIHNSH